LDEAADDLGEPLMIWAKHHGGLGELRQYRDLIRGKEKLYRTTEKQSEEEDGV